jgi:isopenicillin N synthase-like dioxygenase
MVEPVSFLVDIAIGVDNVWDYMVWTAFCARVQACMRSLFFYLVKHGVDQELLDDVFAQIKKLFAHERRRKCFMIRFTVVTQPSRDLESPAASIGTVPSSLSPLNKRGSYHFLYIQLMDLNFQ